MRAIRNAALLAAVGAAAFAAAAASACAGGTMIEGFRSARFGMSRAEVQAAIARDFPASPPSASAASPDPSVHALQVAVLGLNPGPGLATIVYLFDAGADRLAQVNIGWRSPANPTDDERLAIAAAGLRLQSYFNASPPPGCQTGNGGVVNPTTLLMYRAEDTRGGFIELIARNVRFEARSGTPAAPPPGEPATLRLTYSPGALASAD